MTDYHQSEKRALPELFQVVFKSSLKMLISLY